MAVTTGIPAAAARIFRPSSNDHHHPTTFSMEAAGRRNPTTTVKPLPPQKQLPFATPSILHSPEKAKPPSTPPEPPWQPFKTIVNTTLKPKNARHSLSISVSLSHFPLHSLTSVPESRRRVVIRGEVVIASLLRLLYRIFRATLVAGFLGGTFPPVDLLVFCVSDVEHGGGCCEVFRRGGKKKRWRLSGLSRVLVF